MEIHEMEEIHKSRVGERRINREKTMTESADDISEEIQQIEPNQSETEKHTTNQAVDQVGLQNLIQSLNNLNDPESFTIFRVPSYLYDKAKTRYEPRTVSIGPYHHGKKELLSMEEHKRRCLQDFLGRNKERTMDNYYQEMRALVIQARQCYSESVDFDIDQFAIMLLLDGCFILEFFLKQRYSVVDPLCDMGWTRIEIDLILSENQIPFFIIHKLTFLLSDPIGNSSCGDECLLLDLIFPYLPKQKILRKPKISCNEVDHLLHYYYKCMVPEFNTDQNNNQRIQSRSMKTKPFSWLCSWLPWISRENSSLDLYPCATMLNEAGVTFRRKKNPRDMFDITFDDGVMEIPLLSIIDDSTKILFTNVIAFEQSRRSTTIFTSFAALIGFLIYTANDVTLLQKCGVVNNANSEDIAAFMNQLCDGTRMNYDNHHFASLFKDVKKYSNSTWPKYRARLMQDYFSNPWTSISVFAGVILLGLTTAQTYYTIYSAYHH